MKTVKYFFILIIFFAQIASATKIKTYTITSKDYSMASQANQFLKFESESTKLGMITTSFDGYSLKFKVKVKMDGRQILSIDVEFDAKSLDTDSDSRNEKMWEQILEANKYPSISFRSSQAVDLKTKKGKLKGKLKIRDQNRKVVLDYNVEEFPESFKISGLVPIKLTEFKIPDPSIAIASVRDRFDLKFSIIIKK